MTMHLGPRRPRFLIASAAAPILAAVSLLAAGCGSSSHHGKSSGDRDQALAYAQCMRKNGVPDFPDPNAQGRLRGAGHEQQDDPQFRAAMEACRDLAPGGEHEQLADPAFVEQMREFSQCMRENGLPDFPDPDAQGRLRGAGHEQQDTPQDRAAMEVCRGKLPGGGEHR
jgi:ubiquitin